MLKIDINITRSHVFIRLVCLIVIATMLPILSLSIGLLFKLLLCVLITIYGLFIVYYYGSLLHERSILRIGLSDGGWMLWDKKRVYAAKLCGSSTVTRNMMILRFAILGEWMRRTCILLPDSVPSDQYRQLIMSIRNG